MITVDGRVSINRLPRKLLHLRQDRRAAGIPSQAQCFISHEGTVAPGVPKRIFLSSSEIGFGAE